MQQDLFISYSRKDNSTGRVTELKEKIETEYLEFAKEELKCFFDKDEIKGMDDWKQRLLQGLKDSHLMLLILSPNYLASPYCEWEIVEYLKYEYARATQGDGVAQIYFMEIPGLDEPGFQAEAKAWLEKIS
ncbi:MAG: toll/interleukin-1 receptor domain-containing protein, partial [Bacteroidota bacterium]